MSLSELFRDLDPKIAGPLQRITEALRSEISTQIDGVRKDVQSLVAADAPASAPSPPSQRATGGLDALEELKRAAAGIDRSTQQAAILTGLLEGAGRFSSRAAFVLIRDDGQRCWNSLGFDDAHREMQGAPVEVPNGDSAWTRIREGAGTCGLTAEECAVFCSQFEASSPSMGALLPLSLGDQVAGYLYADRVGDEPLNITALQLLTFVAGQTLETLPVRKRSSTPTLTVAEAAAAPAAAAAAVEAEVETPAMAEPEPQEAGETEAPEIETGAGAEASALETAAIDVEPEAEAAEEPAVTDVVTAGAPPLAALEEPADVEAEEPAAVVEAAATESEADFYEVEAPVQEAAPAGVETVDEAVTATESPTAEIPLPPPEELAEPAVDEPAPVEEPPPPAAAPPPAATADGASTQVVPPDDVLGPGWAFTTKEADDDSGNEALHEEARRLARLLVTEIKLYNEEQVEQGRRSGDIYRRLQEDIDRSRQIFEDRIDEKIRGDNDYFKEALVRILAGGDESLLGI